MAAHFKTITHASSVTVLAGLGSREYMKKHLDITDTNIHPRMVVAARLLLELLIDD